MSFIASRSGGTIEIATRVETVKVASTLFEQSSDSSAADSRAPAGGMPCYGQSASAGPRAFLGTAFDAGRLRDR